MEQHLVVTGLDTERRRTSGPGGELEVSGETEELLVSMVMDRPSDRDLRGS